MIRPATHGDREAIARLLDAAFSPSRTESRIAATLLDCESPAWVAVEDAEDADAEIVGCILYSPATRGGEGIGYHLAPVAVRPDFQGRGIGSQLVSETLALEPVGSGPVFVLGAPGYYRRFGFEPVANPACRFDPGNAHFLALRWAEEAGEVPFEVGYHPAFDDEE